jgi:DNA-directed RNA polymerase specialized sigma24 family protein
VEISDKLRYCVDTDWLIAARSQSSHGYPAVGKRMASPSPSDLLWVIGFKPQGRWIVPIVREAVRAEWPIARQIALAQLGDETLARELMESAIEQTHEHLASQPPVAVEEARKVLNLCYRNAVRRQRRANSRLILRGSSADLEPLAPSVPSSANGVEARLDVDTILRDTPTDMRHVLLARYGARTQWNELAKKLDTSKDAIRMASRRELERLRSKLGIQQRGEEQGSD